MLTAIFYNLLVNSIFSLLVGVMVVYFFLWLFKVDTGFAKIYLLSLPFVKIVYDAFRGLPANSLLYSGIDPFALPDHQQMFSVGAGISKWSLFINGIFSVNAPNGARLDASVGDYFVFWLNRNFGMRGPRMILLLTLAISTILILRRFWDIYKFESERVLQRSKDQTLRTEEISYRRIDIYISDFYHGTPFTGGVLNPYVCLPKDAVDAMTEEELQSVIAHEIGHIRSLDLVSTFLIQALGDIFWFIPGYRKLGRTIDRLKEIVADQYAVRNGAKAESLASALIKVTELKISGSRSCHQSAFFREKSLVKERVERLLLIKTDRQPRLGWNFMAVRVFVCIAVSAAVINSVFGGNNRTELLQNPEWFERLIRSLGL